MAKKLTAVMLSVSALFVMIALAMVYTYSAPGPLDQPKTVYIEKGTGFRAITKQLEKENIVYHQSLILVPSILLGKQATFKPGEYAFDTGISPATVIEMLSEGKIVVHKLTIPEGLSVREIVTLIDKAPFLTGEITEIPKEGSLLPETYHYARGDDKNTLISRMQQAMQDEQNKMWENRKPGLPLNSMEEVVILASIVEKEARIEKERPRIAAAYINRLKRGMRLQADPTTIYAIELEQGTPLNRPLVLSDLKRDLPHNTYMRDGLPPTPISNPGKASIEAVLHPSDHKDIFFVTKGDGSHYFAETYAQHKANIEKFRAAREAYRAEQAAAEAAPVDPAEAGTQSSAP